MILRIFPVCVAAAILLSSTAVRGQDASKGAALLAEARTALGGEERLRAITALDVRGDFKRIAGRTTIEGELQVRLQRPDRLRRDEDLSLPGGGPAVIRTEVLNGDIVWEDMSGGGGFVMRRGGGDGGGAGQPDGDAPGRGAVDPGRLEAAQRRLRQAELARYLLAWLLMSDAPAAWIATAEAPDGRADVIEFTPADGTPMRLFLDQATHLPLMVTWQGAAPQLAVVARGGGRGGGRGGRGGAGPEGPPAAMPERGAQATLQMTLGDYKAVNGVRLPHLITRGTNDMTFEEWTIDSYRINQTFRGDVFTK
jgi:hypothetical protein